MATKNTRISYQYRDGSNYKQFQELVLFGTLTVKQQTLIINKLEEGEYFIPSQVGLPDLQDRMISFPNSDDHVWHELHSFEDVTKEQTHPMTAKELLNMFKAVKEWSVEETSKELGIA